MKTFEEIKEHSMIDDDNDDFFATLKIPKEKSKVESYQHFANEPPIEEVHHTEFKELENEPSKGIDTGDFF